MSRTTKADYTFLVGKRVRDHLGTVLESYDAGATYTLDEAKGEHFVRGGYAELAAPAPVDAEADAPEAPQEAGAADPAEAAGGEEQSDDDGTDADDSPAAERGRRRAD